MPRLNEASNMLFRAACGLATAHQAGAGAAQRADGVSGVPACACPAGDLNGDCAVDGADLGALLGDWGSMGAAGDLTGDGIVDGADLGSMLSAWGPCPQVPGCEGYVSMTMAGVVVGGPRAFLPAVVLFGAVDVLDSGEPQGSITAVFGDGSSVAVDVAVATAIVYVDRSVVVLPSAGPPSLAIIDGVTVAIPGMLLQFAADLASGIPPATWSVAGRAVLALAALAETDAFCCDLEMALQDATSASGAFWCKLGLVSLGGCIMAHAAAGCDLLTDGCDESTHRLIGHFPMPCSLLETLCIDGEFAGPQAAFDSVLAMWLGK